MPSEYGLEQLDSFKATHAGSGVEPQETIEIYPAEQTPTAPHVEPSSEATVSEHDERIDLWMKNIREFIRGIDVRAL